MEDGKAEDGGRERLLRDLKLVVRDAAQLMTGGGAQSGEAQEAALARFTATLDAARGSLSEVERLVTDGVRDAADAADRYVRRNPWQSIGVGALAGLALGMLIGRR